MLVKIIFSKMTYDLGTLTGLSVSKNVTVTIAELVAPTMLSTITPTNCFNHNCILFI